MNYMTRKVLILCAHRPARSPSQRYRFEQYLPYLEKNGFQFTFSYLISEKDDQVFYSGGNFLRKVFVIGKGLAKRIKDSFSFKNYHFIFIQRETTFLGTSFFEKKAFRSGAKVIFDFDDSIWIADTSPGNKKWEWLKRPQKFYQNAAAAHLVIAGNDYLAEKARTVNQNTIVIPTTIDTDVHVPMPHLRNSSQVVIGWSGSISTLKHFYTLENVLLKLKEKYDNRIRIRLIADKVFSDDRLKLEVIKWSPETEVKDLNTFDIGIMPLPDNEWEKGKCGLKGLSYMACGVATVMSPVGVNSEIIDNSGNGLLAATEEEWLLAFSRLIESPSLREEMGAAGRRTVEEKYSVAANQHKYLKAFT